jgi:NarL family two-component system response regulator LiaR
VLAVDDHRSFRRAVRDVIAATPGFEQVGEAASGAEALDRAAELQPDLVLLDIRMPGMDGIETSRRLEAARPGTVVVFVSVEPAVEAPEAVGAVAHLRKQDLSPQALRRVWDAHGRER